MNKTLRILLSILLLLSLSGATSYYLLRKDVRPTFTEVDSFLRQFPDADGWQFQRHEPFTHALVRNPGWWEKIGWRQNTRYERADYHFIHKRTKAPLRICLWHEGGRVSYVRYHTTPIKSPEQKTFSQIFLVSFPQLQRAYSYESVRLVF